MAISFSAHTSCTCETCGNRATHGFFHGNSDTEVESFVCTGCAQRTFDKALLQDAIDIHRDVCFERAERANLGVSP